MCCPSFLFCSRFIYCRRCLKSLKLFEGFVQPNVLAVQIERGLFAFQLMSLADHSKRRKTILHIFEVLYQKNGWEYSIMVTMYFGKRKDWLNSYRDSPVHLILNYILLPWIWWCNLRVGRTWFWSRKWENVQVIFVEQGGPLFTCNSRLFSEGIGSLVTCKKLTSTTCKPVSSSTSRFAQSSHVSINSRCPPGKARSPLPWEPCRMPAKICPFRFGSFTRTPTPTRTCFFWTPPLFCISLAIMWLTSNSW